MSSLKDMIGVEEILGLEVVPKIKYLGLDISCNRKYIVKSAKRKIEKFTNYVKGRL